MAVSDHVSHEHDEGHGSLKSYIVGFGLSVLLTLASFGTVMSGVVPHHLMLPGIVIFAVVQLLVQLVFFLHMGTSPGKQGNLAIMLFTLLILAIVVVGSLWVLHNMNANMMHPMLPQMPAQ